VQKQLRIEQSSAKIYQERYNMIQLDVLVRSKRRTVSISVTPEGHIVVRAPNNCPMSFIQNVLDKNQDWILKNKQKMLQNKEINQKVFGYKEVLFLGDCYNVGFSNDVKKPVIFEKTLFLPTSTKQDKIIKTIQKWLRENASKIITERVQYFTNIMRLRPSMVKLGNAKKCWGTCSKTHVITINWRCIMLPPELLDYVIVHELAHMIMFNHSKSFWAIVQSVLPDVKRLKQDLKKGEYLLQLFRF